MRPYSVPTSKNLLRRPLVLGVPFQGLLALALVVLAFSILGGNSLLSNIIACAVAVFGYLALRISKRFLLLGWEESMLFWIEQKLAKPSKFTIIKCSSAIKVESADTLTSSQLLGTKESLKEHLLSLQPRDLFTQVAKISSEGTSLNRIAVFDKPSVLNLDSNLKEFKQTHVYSLHSLPVITDPLWLSHQILRSNSNLKNKIAVYASFRGIDASQIKSKIETSRRSNAADGSKISNIDSEISFSEASRVLEGISRGDESIVEMSLVIASDEPLNLDKRLFCEEKNQDLTLSSIIGIRPRFHRSHTVTVTTATDFIPNFFDPIEIAIPVLSTPKGYLLYFTPLDPRLEALHWLVVGASGSGKSFFVGTILKRLIEKKHPISVLFVDHNRSFKRLIKSINSSYFEPEKLEFVESQVKTALQSLNTPGTMAGIELSDLLFTEKKEAAHQILSSVERFLKSRNSIHPIYIVLDECWNFMRDEPVLVQRAFREFRKLNGAAIAITHSLSDFLKDQSGQCIVQNAPVRILLRQDEDLNQYQGILKLNEVEVEKVKSFRQEKGKFSECLVKTPFLSRLARLCPTDEEHRLLRTDNLREELVRENQEKKGAIYA